MTSLLGLGLQVLIYQIAIASDIQAYIDKGEFRNICIPIDRMYYHLERATAGDNVKKLLENGATINISDTDYCGNYSDVNQLRIYFTDDTFVGIYDVIGDKLKLNILYLET